MFMARNAIFLEREYISKGTSRNKVRLEEIQAPQRSIELVMETQQVSKDIVEPAQVTRSLRRSGRIRQNPERYCVAPNLGVPLTTRKILVDFK